MPRDKTLPWNYRMRSLPDFVVECMEVVYPRPVRLGHVSGVPAEDQIDRLQAEREAYYKWTKGRQEIVDMWDAGLLSDCKPTSAEWSMIRLRARKHTGEYVPRW